MKNQESDDYPYLKFNNELRITIEDITTGNTTSAQLSFLRDDSRLMIRKTYGVIESLLEDLGLIEEKKNNGR